MSLKVTNVGVIYQKTNKNGPIRGYALKLKMSNLKLSTVKDIIFKQESMMTSNMILIAGGFQKSQKMVATLANMSFWQLIQDIA